MARACDRCAALSRKAIGGAIVAPQTVLVEDYWDEIINGLALGGVEVEAVTLVTRHAELVERIRADAVEAPAVAWRIKRLADLVRAPSGSHTPDQARFDDESYA